MNEGNLLKVIIIGGGAAGFFAAICAKAGNPTLDVTILEKSAQLLSKVRISGGGRCNVTHNCFDPKELVKNYPRGAKELLGPFHVFQPRDMVDWFAKRGVELKKEADGRMFPITDSSSTIIDCLMKEAEDLGVRIERQAKIESIICADDGFTLNTKDGHIKAQRVVLATGSSKGGYEFVRSFGHKVKELVPSLFTFNIPDFVFTELSGISMPNATVSIHKGKFSQKGPLLITHFGFSGPAALKLSAFCARELFKANYEIALKVNWVSLKEQEVAEKLLQEKKRNPTIAIGNISLYGMPKSLLRGFLMRLGIKYVAKLSSCTQKDLNRLANLLTSDIFNVSGKTTNKSEFVTCGGIDLKEVNFKTMESKIIEGLFFAGEILDIDGITGGFNFQNAWTTGFIAGSSISKG